MKYAWIAINRQRWPVSVACDMLGVSTSGYFEHMRRKGADDKPVSPEQMELARLRAELSRVKMERDILKKATAYFARESL